jgi:hypothetical protein
MKGGIRFTEPLPGNDRRDINTYILMGGIYEDEMGSGAMVYILSLIKIGSGFQKLIGGIHRQHGDRISLLSFFQNKKQ